MCHFLQENSLLEDFQSGFSLFKDWHIGFILYQHGNNANQSYKWFPHFVWRGMYLFACLLDRIAAVNTIDHHILLERLDNQVGSTGCVVWYFKSYLSDRYQFGHVNDESSK